MHVCVFKCPRSCQEVRHKQGPRFKVKSSTLSRSSKVGPRFDHQNNGPHLVDHTHVCVCVCVCVCVALMVVVGVALTLLFVALISINVCLCRRLLRHQRHQCPRHRHQQQQQEQCSDGRMMTSIELMNNECYASSVPNYYITANGTAAGAAACGDDDGAVGGDLSCSSYDYLTTTDAGNSSPINFYKPQATYSNVEPDADQYYEDIDVYLTPITERQ